MRLKTQAVFAVTAVLLAFFMTGQVIAQQPKETKKQRDATVLQLAISKDGKSIVDQNGNVVATFVKGTTFRMKSREMKSGDFTIKHPQGCAHCYNECAIYDENGRCVSWSRTCDWDFDC